MNLDFWKALKSTFEALEMGITQPLPSGYDEKT
jgi:hypothetical protein